MQDWRNPDADDPKGLIRESYRIDRITEGECRSILIDWALSLPSGQDEIAALTRLRARHGPPDPAHPMNRLIDAALAAPADHASGARLQGRKGGRAARLNRASGSQPDLEAPGEG